MRECYNCSNWDDSSWIMNRYGEGSGLCCLQNKITFCNHECQLTLKNNATDILQGENDERNVH